MPPCGDASGQRRGHQNTECRGKTYLKKEKKAHPLRPMSPTFPSDDGGNVTTGDKPEESKGEGFSDGDKVGEQRFVDYTFYRRMIG